jgi:hypothetical protein
MSNATATKPKAETASEKKTRLSRPREESMTDILNTLKANRERHARLLAEDDEKIKEQEAKITNFNKGRAEREAKAARLAEEKKAREAKKAENAPAEIAKLEAAAARAIAKAEEYKKLIAGKK